MMHFKSSFRVCVLDLTHGGRVIALKLKRLVSSISAVDVYKTLSHEELKDLERNGIRTSQSALKASDFDVIVSPVHLDTSYPMLVEALNNNIPVLSHHATVGEILRTYDLEDKTLIEISGTKAKTSTAVLVSEILSKGKKVVSHTSRGLENWSTKKLIKKGLSITPASLLSALDCIHEAGIEFEVFVAEISLGGTGCADIGVITTIAGDYKIAGNTRLASDAKRQMILDAKLGSKLVINNDALRFFGACRRDVDVVSVSDDVNASCNVYYEDANTIAYFLGKKKGRIHIPDASDYDINAYKTAFACATAVALTMNTDAHAIENTIQKFKGAEGRMRKISFQGRTLIDNSNSGLDIRMAEKALLFSKAQGERLVMVLGEEAKEVCEGLDPKGVEVFIQRHLNELEALVLVGARMKPFANIENNIHYGENLTSGIELAKKLTQKGDIILSCVKCFR